MVSPALIADLGVTGVWIPRVKTLYAAAFYVNHSVSAVLATAEGDKKCRHLSAVELHRATLT